MMTEATWAARSRTCSRWRRTSAHDGGEVEPDEIGAGDLVALKGVVNTRSARAGGLGRPAGGLDGSGEATGAQAHAIS
jgi:hypothetical protein